MGKQKSIFEKFLQKPYLKWLVLVLLVGGLVGTASALFLETLSYATKTREENTWLIFLLPFAGVFIHWSYQKWGRDSEKGNNKIIEEYYQPQTKVSSWMAPLVFVGTILTHLFGGSAGREGTAVQMGASISDQFSSLFDLVRNERRLLLILGMSAGFASVFGTPLTGAIFSMEVLLFKNAKWKMLLPTVLVAYIADFVCNYWGVLHTHYSAVTLPSLSIYSFIWFVFLAVCAGLMAYLFVVARRIWNKMFSWIKPEWLRPFVGGLVIAIAVVLLGTTKYVGLGIPVITDAFTKPLEIYDSVAKLLFTTFTLSAGFKGGEVTPLFYIGATLGNSFAYFSSLPMSFLAAIGFVGVFAGATKAPLACSIMAIELFGIATWPYALLACYVAYSCSGPIGIYEAQERSVLLNWPKTLWGKIKNPNRKG